MKLRKILNKATRVVIEKREKELFSLPKKLIIYLDKEEKTKQVIQPTSLFAEGYENYLKLTQAITDNKFHRFETI